MRRQVLFVQGGGARAHDDWDSKLVDSLTHELGPTFEIRYPRMPHEDDPRYVAWRETIWKEIDALDDGAIVVGHSVGATILVTALAERAPGCRLGAIVLISAPFVGEGGWPSEDIQIPRDLGARLPSAVPVYIYHGLDDETAPPSHAELYERVIPTARIRRLPGRDHQLNNDLREVAAAITSLDHDA